MLKKTIYLIQFKEKIQFIEKIYLYAKDLEEPKYQFSIKKREQAGIKHLKNPTAFIEYSNNMDDIYDDIND